MTNWSQLGVAAIANGEHLKSGKALHIHDDDEDVDDDDDEDIYDIHDSYSCTLIFAVWFTLFAHLIIES